MLKVSRMVNMKLQIDIYYLIILINLVMQNPIPKFRQSSIISEKPVYFSEKLNTLASSNYHRV